ncbi:putative transferase [Helianthus anomalus]
MKAVPADFQSPSPNLNVFKFADLEKATRMFSLDLLLGEGGFGKVFLGWVEQNTLAPSKQGVGIAVAVKRFHQEGLQGRRQWLVSINKCTSTYTCKESYKFEIWRKNIIFYN